MEMECVTEFPHTHMDRRPRKRPRFAWDAPQLHPKVKLETSLAAFGCPELEFPYLDSDFVQPNAALYYDCPFFFFIVKDLIVSG